MKKSNYILYGALVFVLNTSLFSAVLKNDRFYEWNKAGLKKEISFEDTLNVLDYGFDFTGKTSNHILLNNMIESINKPTLIYFPNGDYLFNGQIILKDNIGIAGDNPDNTIFIFDNEGSSHLFNIYGSKTNNIKSINQSINKNNDYVIVENQNFNIGYFVYIFDNDFDKITSDWAKNSTGQILQISSIAGDSIFFESKIRRDYNFQNKPKLKEIKPIKNVLIEDISIIRKDKTESQTSNIHFQYAVNCKVKCIVSQNCNYAHIEANFSSNLEINGSYFWDGFDYGGGGKAYGIMLHFGTSECLIYNNKFNHLRHSMIVQAGANGNVFSYNYSKNPYWTEVSLPDNSAGDIVLHGNYPYANLFEGNICQNIVLDDSHGKNGPHNTFFRNRAELYGIFMNFNPASDEQNFIGNEITNTEPLKGLYFLNGENHFEWGNNVKSEIIPANTGNLSDSTYYLTESPLWYNSNEEFPPIGPPNNLEEYDISAKLRKSFVACEYIPAIVNEKNCIENIRLSPNPAKNYIEIDLGKYNRARPIALEIKIYDVYGSTISCYSVNKSQSYRIDISHFPAGMYFVKVGDKILKFVKL